MEKRGEFLLALLIFVVFAVMLWFVPQVKPQQQEGMTGLSAVFVLAFAIILGVAVRLSNHLARRRG